MDISYRWLQSLAPSLVDSPQRLAERLAMQGAPVDEIIDLGGPLGSVLIARTLDVRRHPNADRLSVCTVDAGGEPLQVVCGAPNVRAGAFYPFAPAGSGLPGGVTIKRARIRGVESNGMLCSARELEIGRDQEGILELHGTFTPGARFIDAVGLDDVRLVLDVTPNRPDLLSHWGVARELAEGGEAGLRLPAVPGAPPLAFDFAPGGPTPASGPVPIALEDRGGCPRYIGIVVRGVRVGPSPEWLAARLRAVGQRPINNVVDATNYALQELGQPLHAFDLATLHGPSVVVRRARAGETIVTLDGEPRALTPANLVIADADRPIALAGVMGGQDTEVREATADILLECALFDPRTIRASRRALGMSTDASYRFERGVDPDGMARAAVRTVSLILATAGGVVDGAPGVADAGIAPVPPIRLRPRRLSRVLGVEVGADEAASLLTPLGFRVERAGDDLSVAVPGHRRYDVTREDDLVEEVARRRGYDTFPDDARPFRASSIADDAMAILEDRLRTLLSAWGFLEARSVPFVPEAEGDVALMLPLSSAESRLRRALVPGLIRRLEANFNRGARDLRLYEIGTVFAPGPEGLPRETTRLAAVMTGARSPAHWSGDARDWDLWDARGLAEEIGRLCGLDIDSGPETGSGTRAGFPAEPGTGVGFRFAGAPWPGLAGRVASGSLDAPSWAAGVLAIEVDLDVSMGRTVTVPFRPLPAQPAVERDLALVLPAGTAASAVEGCIRSAAGPMLESVMPFDVYGGGGLPAGARSVAFRLRFRVPDRTLTDPEVDRFVGRVLDRLLEEHHVERRT
jgi:phenylalanyl-tRNA synthetase beta chain